MKNAMLLTILILCLTPAVSGQVIDLPSAYEGSNPWYSKEYEFRMLTPKQAGEKTSLQYLRQGTNAKDRTGWRFKEAVEVGVNAGRLQASKRGETFNDNSFRFDLEEFLSKHKQG